MGRLSPVLPDMAPAYQVLRNLPTELHSRTFDALPQRASGDNHEPTGVKRAVVVHP